MLKRERPEILVVAVEPAHSPVLQGRKFRAHATEEIRVSFIPNAPNWIICDEVFGVRDEEALAVTRRLSREEGLLVGMSPRANVVAALWVVERFGRGKTVVGMLRDTGERPQRRYLRVVLFPRQRVRGGRRWR